MVRVGALAKIFTPHSYIDLKTGHVDHLLFLSVFPIFSRTFYVDIVNCIFIR